MPGFIFCELAGSFANAAVSAFSVYKDVFILKDNNLLQKFQKFKAMIISSNVPNNLLLEMLENYLISEDEPATEMIPILDGQLSLFDTTA